MVQDLSQHQVAFCAICQTAVLDGDIATRCPDCNSTYHSECWEENNGCAVYGCPRVPPTEGRAALEIPASFWGQENKPCPRCGKEILAAAVRCRYCGATFSTSRPEDRIEFNRKQVISSQQPGLKRNSVLLFVFCALPCTALIASVFGAFWVAQNKQGLASIPRLYSGMAQIGLGIGFGQTLLLLALIVIYSISH